MTVPNLQQQAIIGHTRGAVPFRAPAGMGEARVLAAQVAGAVDGDSPRFYAACSKGRAVLEEVERLRVSRYAIN